MTSFPALALPASASRRRSSAPRARPRATSAPWGPRHDDQLPRRWPCPPSIIGTTGTAAGNVARASRGDRGNRGTMTSFPASAFRLSIDGHGGTCEPWGPWHDDQLPRRWPCRRQLPAVDRRHHGDRGTCEPWHAARSTMTSLPGAGLARRRSSARCQARQTGRRRSSAPRGPRHV